MLVLCHVSYRCVQCAVGCMTPSFVPRPDYCLSVIRLLYLISLKNIVYFTFHFPCCYRHLRHIQTLYSIRYPFRHNMIPWMISFHHTVRSTRLLFRIPGPIGWERYMNTELAKTKPRMRNCKVKIVVQTYIIWSRKSLKALDKRIERCVAFVISLFCLMYISMKDSLS